MFRGRQYPVFSKRMFNKFWIFYQENQKIIFK